MLGCLVIAAVGPLAGCSTTQLSDSPVERQEWTSPAGVKGEEILTPHFDLRVTATDKELLEYLPNFMEAAFQGYTELMPPAETPTDRLIVYVFGTRDQWAEFTTVTYPQQAWTYLHIHSGGYTDVPSATAVGYDLRRDRTLSLLAHEGLHQYLARYFPQPVTPWLNEGLACQWEAFDLVGRHPIFTPRRNFLRRNDLREALTMKQGMIPLPALLGMDAGAAIRQTGRPVRAYYAQVWSLVLFLRESLQYARGLPGPAGRRGHAAAGHGRQRPPRRRSGCTRHERRRGDLPAVHHRGSRRLLRGVPPLLRGAGGSSRGDIATDVSVTVATRCRR